MKIDIPLASYKAAIFDMDGTMIDNMDHHKRAWQAFLKQHDITLTEEEFRNKISGKKNDQIFELVFGRKLIETLHAHGIKTAIATTAPAKNRDFALKELGLDDKFEVILGDEHVSKGKPHPEIYESTAKQLGIVPEECLVFEDSPSGVASGKGAGMAVVGILSSHSANELRDADYVVDDFSGIQFS